VHLRSLRFKLTLWYVLILGVLLISFSSFLYMTLSRSLLRDVDDRLRSLAGLIASESGSPTSQFGFGDIDQTLQASMGLRPAGKFIQVLDESGRIGQRSDNLRNIQLPVSFAALRNGVRGLPTYETLRPLGVPPLRVITYPVLESYHIARIVQVASSLEDVEDALNTLFIILTVTVPLALLVASLGGQFLANQALKPVGQVTQTARLITSQNLNQRIRVPKGRDELSNLVETFNEMILRLGQSFDQIKQFTSDASHELKTPLTVLKGEMEVALRKERPSREYEQVIRSNLEEINRMSRIVEALLLLSKTDTGEIRLEKEEVNLSEIVRDVVGQLSLLAEAKSLRLLTPNHHEDIHVFADGLRIRQLLLNLIDNGIKYTEPGGFIQVELQKNSPLAASANPNQGGGSVKITVSDSGIGISKEDQERIFDRFYRADKARSRDLGGSGLGLSICKWIVQAHRGQIAVDSDLGKGSVFTVTLPLHSP
jgi:heavy metal sensor kinase